MWNCYEEGEKKKHLNSSGQDKCEKRVREENLPFPSNKNTTTKKSAVIKGLNTHTHTHKNEIDYLGSFFFFFFFYILDILNQKKKFFFVLIFECRWVGNVYSYLCKFLPFQSFFFFFLVSFVFLFLLFFSRCSQGPYCIFFFLSSSSARFPTPSSLDSFLFFFYQVFLHPGHGTILKTLPPHPPHIISLSLLTMSSS